MPSEIPSTDIWTRRLACGDSQALAEAFGYFRPRLRSMVQMRLDPRLAARVDPSDVLQEAYLDAAQQVQAYVARPRVMLYVWLRGLAWERLLKVQRRHLGTQRRAVGRELSLPAESSIMLARQVFAQGPTPSEAMQQDELRQRLLRGLEQLHPVDREVILMRHFEGMSNNEVAEALGVKPAGATMRYGRALFRLKELLISQSSGSGQ